MVEAWAVALAGSPWIFLVVYLFATIDGFFPPIPSESVVIALAALAISQGTPNLWLLMLAAALGAFTGDQIAYQIGTRVKVHELRMFRPARARAAILWAQEALARRGATFIISARFVPVGRVAVNMTAGAVGYPRRRFVGLAAIASTSWAMYAALIGIGAGAWFGDHTMLGVLVGVVGGVTLGFLIDRVLRRLTRTEHAPHEQTAGATVLAEPAATEREPAGVA
ncbi:DedA family protein [Cellulomonas sp. McL0617]|uniref:DedA family protein n=1 Tax=Cellulomonas sp. McL0617 TaxID=3415675 RepID=UPI003CF5316C